MYRSLVVDFVLCSVVPCISLKVQVHETTSQSSPKIGIVSGFHCEKSSIDEDRYLNSDKCDKPIRKAIRKYGIRNKKDYAQKHGWGMEWETEIGGEWNKLLMIKKYLPKYDWILWMDDDTMFFDLEPDYSQCYDLANVDQDLILSRGNKILNFPEVHDSVNAGIMWIRNSPWAHEFIDELLSIGQNETAFFELATEFKRVRHGKIHSRGEQDMIGWVLKKRNELHKAGTLSESMQAIVGSYGEQQVKELKEQAANGEVKPMALHLAGCFFHPDREQFCQEALPHITNLVEEPKVGMHSCPIDGIFTDAHTKELRANMHDRKATSKTPARKWER